MGRVCNDDAFYMWWIQVPIKTMLIDGNCRVEDRGLKTHHGHVSSLNFTFSVTILLLQVLIGRQYVVLWIATSGLDIIFIS